MVQTIIQNLLLPKFILFKIRHLLEKMIIKRLFKSNECLIFVPVMKTTPVNQTKEPESQDARQRILSKAEELFAENGFRKAQASAL